MNSKLPASEELKILIAEDDYFFRDGLINSFKDEYIEIDGIERKLNVIADVCNGEEAVCKCRELKPDLVFMDIQMSLKTGIEALAHIRENDKNTKVIMITSFDIDEYIINSISNSCNGFLIKNDMNPNTIKLCIKQVFSGIFFISERSIQKMINIMPNPIPKPTPLKPIESYDFSKTQMEIFKLISKGNSNEEIAGILSLKSSTISNNVTEIMKKTNMENRYKLQSLGTAYGYHID